MNFFDSSSDQFKHIVYVGPSMNPILKAPDRLFFIPYVNQKIRRGDVIIFIPPGENQKVTHRVISIDNQKIRTQGDNNNNVDLWVLSPNNILGQVVYVQRGNRRRRVFGGTIGRLFVVIVRVLLVIDKKISKLLGPIYDRMAQAGIFRRCLPFSLETRVLSFNRRGGTELQLLMKKYVVGRYLPKRKQWQIRRPFRLFIDEISLPQPNVPE